MTLASDEAENPRAVVGGNNPPSVTELLRETQAKLIHEVDELANDANKARDELTKDLAEGEEIKIRTDEQRDVFVAIGIRAAKLARRLSETRLETTKPLREQVDETNKFFNTLQIRPDRVKEFFETALGAYDKAKRDAERRQAAEAARLADEEAARKLDEASAAQHSVISDVVMNEAAEADHRARSLAAKATTAGSGPTRTEAGTISSTAPWTHTVTDWSKVDLRELRDSFTPDEIEKAIRKHVRTHKNTRPLAGVSISQDTKTRLRG